MATAKRRVDPKKKKRKPSSGGQPLYTPELGQIICTHIATGQSLIKWVAGKGIGPKPRPAYSTIWHWRRDVESFRLAFDAAYEAGTHFDAERIRDLAEDKTIPIERARLMIETRKWLLPKRNRKDFGDKIEVDANITLDDDQQIAKLSELLKKSFGLDKEAEDGSSGGA